MANGTVTNIDGKFPNTIGLRGSGVRYTGDVWAAGSQTEWGNPNNTGSGFGWLSGLNYQYGFNAWGPGGTGGKKWHVGYAWLAGKPLDTNTMSIENPQENAALYRRVKVTVTPDSSGGNHTIRVFMSNPLNVNQDVCLDGTEENCDQWAADPANVQLVEQFSYQMTNAEYQANIPATFNLGFGASTGYAVNYHQIRNISVRAEADPGVTKKIMNIPLAGSAPTGWEDAVGSSPGDTFEYKIGLYNNGPTDLDTDFPVQLTDGLAGLPLDDLTWCAYPESEGQFAYENTGTDWDWINSTKRDANYCDTSTNWGSGDLPEFVWTASADSSSTSPEVTVLIKGRVTLAAANSTWVNTAVITPDTTGGPQDSNPNNNRDSAQFKAGPAPKWTVAKDSDPESGENVNGGDTVTYTVTAEAEDVGPSATAENLTVYLQEPAGWTNAYMHYKRGTCGAGGWTTVPGVQMVQSEFPDYWEITLTGTEAACVTFNNGNNTWLNNSGANFQIPQGGGYATGTAAYGSSFNGINPGGQTWSQVNATIPPPPVVNPVITDDLSGVLAGVDGAPGHVRERLCSSAG